MRSREAVSADRDRQILALWEERPRVKRTAYDVLTFYGWLTDIHPRLIPRGPGSYEYIRQLLAAHLIGGPDAAD